MLSHRAILFHEPTWDKLLKGFKFKDPNRYFRYTIPNERRNFNHPEAHNIVSGTKLVNGIQSFESRDRVSSYWLLNTIFSKDKYPIPIRKYATATNIMDDEIQTFRNHKETQCRESIIMDEVKN